MTVTGGIQHHGLAAMNVGERRSQESEVWKAMSVGLSEHSREKSRFRIAEDDGRKTPKASEAGSEESVLFSVNGCFHERVKDHQRVKLQEEMRKAPVILEDVVLQVKETQTRGRREEKGLQISMGRHVNRAPTVLAQTAAQTDRPALYSVLKEKARVYRTPIMFYLTAMLVSFISVYTSFLLVSAIKGATPVEVAVPPPTFWGRVGNVIGTFMHNCRHCPMHR